MRIKTLLTTFIIATFSTSLFAQRPFPKEHAFGVTGGVILSEMTFRPTVIQDYKLGPTFGVTYRYIEEKYFGIQAEILYTQRGWKERLEDYPALYYNRTLNYIEVPIMSHIFFGNDKFRGFVNLGPKFGVFLNDTKNTNISEPLEDLESAQHDMRVSTKFDYGITAGGGVELRFGKNSILLEGRYYFGLGDIFPNDKKDVFEASANQNIQISATYLFRIKRK